jgi:exonuclease VII large subunit
MVHDRTLIASFAVFLGAATPSAAQDYGAMLQQQMQQFDQLGQQMQAHEGQIVQQNMQNPQIQAMYQDYLAQGGTLNFQQFAYQYAATGGYTQQGMANYQQSERAIQQREQAAIQAYRENQAQNAQAMQQMYQRQDDIAHQRGNLLNGTTDYYDPGTGAQYNLPHTVPSNTSLYDPSTGETFDRDEQGFYQRQDPNGWRSDLEEVQ